MKVHESRWLKITINKSGRGQNWLWKPKQVPHRSSMADMRYDSHGCVYKSTHYFVTSFMQIFWLWFVVGIEIKRERLGENKYVNYSDTHYSNIDEALNPQP